MLLFAFLLLLAISQTTSLPSIDKDGPLDLAEIECRKECWKLIHMPEPVKPIESKISIMNDFIAAVLDGAESKMKIQYSKAARLHGKNKDYPAFKKVGNQFLSVHSTSTCAVLTQPSSKWTK
jgi:hypothetical protein